MFLGTVLTLSSCMWGKPHNPKAAITKDTLKYAYHTLKQHAANCGKPQPGNCAAFEIKYPVFFSQQTLNDTVTRKMTVLFESNTADTSLHQLIDRFFKAWDKNVSHTPTVYTLNIKTIVLRQDSGFTTLEIDGNTYQGGAHGSLMTSFINWNTKTKKTVSLTDILVNNYEETLTRIADTIFRKQEKLSDIAPLDKDYFFKDGKFALNKNYSITPLGIKFLYNPMEIKPYAAGQTGLFVPYAKIKLLLQPNTVVSQYIK